VCAAGYGTFHLYRSGASDVLKYTGLVLAIVGLVLCYVLLNRSLRKIGLTIWRLRSVKICVVASIFQTIVGCIYLYAAFYLPATNIFLQKPIIYTAITCVIAIHGYMLYANIRQTRLIFLSLTIGLFELAASIGVVIVGLLYVLSKNIKSTSRNGNNPTRPNQSIIGGAETFEATAFLQGHLPTKVRVQANSTIDAIRILEVQYGQNAFPSGVHPRKV
jgi:hypothetical protein